MLIDADCSCDDHPSSSLLGEQRTHTMLVFLSEVAEEDGGGHLHFPRLGPGLGDSEADGWLTDEAE